MASPQLLATPLTRLFGIEVCSAPPPPPPAPPSLPARPRPRESTPGMGASPQSQRPAGARVVADSGMCACAGGGWGGVGARACSTRCFWPV